MQEYKHTGRECFYYIVRHWRKLLIGAAAVGILFGAYRGYKTARDWNANTAEIKDYNANYEIALKNYNSSVEYYDEAIAAANAELDAMNEENEDNPVFSYDPETVCESSISLAICAINANGDTSEAPDVVKVLFDESLENNISWDKIAEKAGVSELVAKSAFIKISNDKGSIITLSFFGPDSATSEALLDSYLDQAAPVRKSIENKFTDIFIKDANRTMTEGASQEYANLKSILNSRTIDKINMINVLNEEKGALVVPSQSTATVPSAGKVVLSLIKHTLFGIAVGLLLMAAFYYVFFYFGGRITSSGELSYYTDSNVILCFDDERKNKLDKILSRLDSKKCIYDKDEAVMRIISSIKASHPDAGKVMFTGTVDEKTLHGLKESIEKHASGMLFGIENNILSDKVTLEHISHYDVIVDVERNYKSDKYIVLKQLDNIAEYGKPVVGCLLFV